MRRLVRIALALILFCLPAFGSVGRTAEAASADWEVPGGHFFTQTAPPGQGFSVIDTNGPPFWTAVQRAGGIAATGYPISQPFSWGGFPVQAFQKVILQWQPATGQMAFLNVFDLMHDRGLDPWLKQVRAVPEPLTI